MEAKGKYGGKGIPVASQSRDERHVQEYALLRPVEYLVGWLRRKKHPILRKQWLLFDKLHPAVLRLAFIRVI